VISSNHLVKSISHLPESSSHLGITIKVIITITKKNQKTLENQEKYLKNPQKIHTKLPKILNKPAENPQNLQKTFKKSFYSN
jgi:hypothetical protein